MPLLCFTEQQAVLVNKLASIQNVSQRVSNEQGSSKLRTIKSKLHGGTTTVQNGIWMVELPSYGFLTKKKAYLLHEHIAVS